MWLAAAASPGEYWWMHKTPNQHNFSLFSHFFSGSELVKIFLKCWKKHLFTFIIFLVRCADGIVRGGVFLCVCLSVCLPACPRAYLPNQTSALHWILYACCLWSWLGPVPAALWYVMYFRLYWWRHSWSRGGMSKVTATPLQRRTQANTPAVWCRLRPLPDASGCQDWTILSCKGCRDQSLRCVEMIF